MKIPKEKAEILLNGSMKQIWEAFIALENEYKEYSEDYEKVRYGIKVEFEIYELWEPETTSLIEKFPRDRKVKIGNKSYSIEDFRTEKEERRKIMVEAIFCNIAEDLTLEPR